MIGPKGVRVSEKELTKVGPKKQKPNKDLHRKKKPIENQGLGKGS